MRLEYVCVCVCAGVNTQEPWWLFSLTPSEMGTNTRLVNWQQHASAASSQTSLFCWDDILWSLLFEYFWHILGGWVLPLPFLTGAAYRPRPPRRGGRRPAGIPAHADRRSCRGLLMRSWVGSWPSSCISSETSAFFFNITEYIWWGERNWLSHDAAGRTDALH